MKVRLTKRENLMKAANRANLVKVAVQVNGRTGQYSSHRWKNPGAALNVLKETMKRAGVKTTDELEFKDRKSKKTLNEDELIKQYKESKTTDTLQDFVKKNYTVSKAKDKTKEEKVKEKKPKRNQKTVTAAEEKPKQDKQADPNLEEAIDTLKGRAGKKNIKIERENGRTYVSASPLDKEFNEQVKKIGGKWDRERFQWSVRQGREEDLRNLIAEYYGWDERENEYVVVKYGAPTVASHNKANRLGNLIVARRRRNDEPVDLSYDTVVLKGEFPETSPSNKFPMVDADFDMEFATILPKKVYDSFDGPLQRSMKVVWEGEVGEKKDIGEPPKWEGSWFENITLEGSEKQKKWAADIRDEFYESYKKILEKTKNVTPKDSAAERKLTNYARCMLGNTSSIDWIENRHNMSPEKILQSVYEITALESLSHGKEFGNLKEKLPNVEGMSDYTADLRTRIVENALSNCYEILAWITQRPETFEYDKETNGFIESTLNALSNSDPDYWAGAVAFFFNIDLHRAGENPPISDFSHQIESFFNSKNELEPKLFGYAGAASPEEATEKKQEALKTRSGLAAKLLRAEALMDDKEKSEAEGRKVDSNKYNEIDGLTRESLETARKIFETEVTSNFWYDNKEIGSIQDLIKANTTEAELSAYEIIFRSHSKRAREAREARHKDATKVDSKGDYKEVANYGELKKNLSLLKDSKTEVVGRAAMDMVGLTSPLYVKKETPFIIGGNFAHGYCEYDFANPDNTNNVAEIGVVDYKENRQQSFKTSIHETMHGAFGNIKLSDGKPLATVIPHKNHEGIVEIIGQATTKAAYGDKYNDPKPSYLRFVVDTALRLRSRDEFKGKSVHQIGEYLGEKAIAKDAKYFEDLSSFLDKNKRVGLRGDVVNELLKNTDKVENVAKKEHERAGNGDFEKSNLANLVEQMKAGLITLQGALNSSQYGDVAVVLLYRLLEEDEEAAETLSAFQ